MAVLETIEKRRRKRERIIAGIILLLLVLFTAVEIHLLKLSSKLPFVNSIFFFGLMNVNIILIMLLLFLVFRNAVKLILDERRGKFASRLKTRLVFCFTLFAIIPTAFLFIISTFYIKSSFDKWSNIKVGGTLQRSIEVVKTYYENTQKNATHFARKTAFLLEDLPKGSEPFFRKIQEARQEYGVDALEYYSDAFTPRLISTQPEKLELIPQASLETLQRALTGSNECRIQNVGKGELVRCGAYLGSGRGVVFADYFIPIGLASQLSEINMTYADYRSDNPLNYPIKSTYFTILSMVTLLILFSATWTGFYVARRLTGPLEELSKGTEAVAKGNLEYVIPSTGGDELRKLIDSFNKMTRDLKRINEELNQRRRYIEVLVESVQSGVLSLDEHGNISTINEAALKLLQVESKEVIGKTYWNIIPEEHQEEFRDLLFALYGKAKPIRHEFKIRIPDRESVTLLFTMSVLRDDSKNQVGVVVVLDNLTEIQKVERMLAWREVAKRIAHEIKNPLTPIQLSVQRLRRRYLDTINDDGTFGEATQIILTEVDSLKTLVNEFSTFARLPEIKQLPENINNIAIETANLFRAAHETIYFDLDLASDLPIVDLDRAQLKRALINLFDNAVAAMSGSGRIKVVSSLDSTTGSITLTVADEGCGIDTSTYDQLFEPYFSLKQGGTGLGLAIVQRIVADHGGSVRVTANQPKGTRFTMEFPSSLIIQKRQSKAEVTV